MTCNPESVVELVGLQQVADPVEEASRVAAAIKIQSLQRGRTERKKFLKMKQENEQKKLEKVLR